MKNLLITLGDSWTEGVGCYSPKTREKFKNSTKLEQQDYIDDRERFHKNGWPIRLQHMLGYEQLINVGRGGSSISGVLKNFIDKYDKKDFSTYDNVVIIWLLTYPARFSFYSGGKIENILSHPHPHEPKETQDLRNTYFNFIKDKGDFFRETFFHVKMMNSWCSVRNINFVFSMMDQCMSININHYYEHDNFFPYILPSNTEFPHLFSEICGHPNEDGYQYIAESMFEQISNKFSHLIISTPPEKYTMVYDGDVIQHVNVLL
jgi:hypothetical protein